MTTEGEEAAARSAAADDMINDYGDHPPQDVSSSGDEKTTSIGSLLEIANSIRKDNNLPATDKNGEFNDFTDPCDTDGAVENDTHPAGDANTQSKVGRPAYSAATVAAISSLAAGESPLFLDSENGDGDENNTAGDKSASSSALVKKEITLEDRASAIMAVYKDYLDEVKDDEDDQNENGAEMAATEEDAINIPFHTVKHRPLNVHERRKEGHKVAVLDKFCKNVLTGNISVNGGGYYDDSDDDDDDSSAKGSHYSKSSSTKTSKKKRYTNHPTAASTTAAFRLRAEVALKAAATKTKVIAKNAAVVVKTRYKDKTTSPTKLVEKIGRGVENDFDFANYDVNGDVEDARFLSNNNKKSDDDMEYGLPPPSSQFENGGGLYGMHMLQREEEIKSLKRKGRIDTEEMESMQRFNDMCDELGVTPQSHSKLHYFYQQHRSRYKYPIFRSKKCKRAMLYGSICLGFAVMVVALISAFTNGFQDIKRNSAKPLPDWKGDEDWREKEKEIWEKDHGGFVGMNMRPTQQTTIVKLFHPHWFSDNEGWSGTTYEDATHFCGSIRIESNPDQPLHMCPLQAYCPNGPIDYKPLYFQMSAYEGEQWAPIGDNNHHWVMIGTEGYPTCVVNPLQLSVDMLPPMVKKHIMCCQGSSQSSVAGDANSTPETADDAIASANQLEQLFYTVSSAYRPIWYDRSTGWLGQTYQEAETWCDSYNSYIPCPFEVYCPNQKSLMSGILDQEGESWAPVVNQENEWVQVGTGGVCQLYSDRYGTKPDWGVSGANNEAITRHIMCCRAHALQHDEVPQQQSDQYVVKATSPPPPLPTAIQQNDEESELNFEMLELSLTQHYNPTWFSRDTGWLGQTYQESKDFCNKLNGYIPCPFIVYCPGDGKQVFGGRKDEGESWAAVIDADNEWVQVGAGGECNLYSASEGENPGWGFTGDNNEEVTRHIMCCQYHAEDGGEESNVESDSGTVEEESATETSVINTDETNVEEPQSGNAAQNEQTSQMTMLEIATQGTFHPEWFDSRLGWLGGTYDEAKAFCGSLPQANGGHWYLCPGDAFCPNGPRENEPLYLQNDAFEGIQWAPISNEHNGWIMVGKMSQQQPHTCEEYFQINHHDPLWGLDGSSTDMKQHILCCNTPSGIYMSDGDEGDNIQGKPSKPNHDESILLAAFTPRWFGVADGWNSGSHDDAIAFCEQHDGIHGKEMELCPYAAYCAEGPGTQPIGGHQIDLNGKGQQWAPLFGLENHWVSISSLHTCMSHWEVNGEEPSWGLDASNPDVKKHVLCCSPIQ